MTGWARSRAKLRAWVTVAPPIAEKVSALAAKEQITVGEWLRRVVEREVERRG